MRPLALTVVFAAALFVGCNQPAPGRLIACGDVEPSAAFEAGRQTLTMYGFDIQEADVSAGSITAVRAVDMPGERIIGKSPARQVAHMTVARSNGNTMLSLEVAIQRQGSAVRTAIAATDSYSSVPNYTSAEMESLPAEQMESWQRTGRDHKLETDIIQDIRKRLQ